MDLSVAKSQRRSSVVRKRGRPAGKNRIPLSLDERRARNAEYERERRVEMGDALKELAAAIGSENINTEGLLAEVIVFLRTSEERRYSWSTDAMRRCNDNLASQILMLERRLATEPDPRVPVPAKREMDGDEWSFPPSKRLALDPACYTATTAPDHGSPNLLHDVQSSSSQWFAPVSEVHPLQPDRIPELHSAWQHQDSSAFLLSCYDNQHQNLHASLGVPTFEDSTAWTEIKFEPDSVPVSHSTSPWDPSAFPVPCGDEQDYSLQSSCPDVSEVSQFRVPDKQAGLRREDFREMDAVLTGSLSFAGSPQQPVRLSLAELVALYW